MDKERCKIKPAEFFDVAAQQGFYGLERSGLTGKKGPQIAVILRNIEMSLGQALGCGHGLLCVVEITDPLNDR